jgi:hypothetical protein
LERTAKQKKKKILLNPKFGIHGHQFNGLSINSDLMEILETLG